MGQKESRVRRCLEIWGHPKKTSKKRYKIITWVIPHHFGVNYRKRESLLWNFALNTCGIIISFISYERKNNDDSKTGKIWPIEAIMSKPPPERNTLLEINICVTTSSIKNHVIPFHLCLIYFVFLSTVTDDLIPLIKHTSKSIIPQEKRNSAQRVGQSVWLSGLMWKSSTRRRNLFIICWYRSIYDYNLEEHWLGFASKKEGGGVMDSNLFLQQLNFRPSISRKKALPSGIFKTNNWPLQKSIGKKRTSAETYSKHRMKVMY